MESLDFIKFGTCVDCIKGKQTNKTKKGVTFCKSYTLIFVAHFQKCV